MNDCEMAIEILRKTNDGNDLCPRHLWLIENAVNGKLNDRGQEEFKELYEKVISGKYQRPYFHGIEHLTINHQGMVCWKDKEIENYSFPYAFSKEAQEAARELAERCRHLEKIGVEINSINVIWHWSKYKDKKKARRSK